MLNQLLSKLNIQKPSNSSVNNYNYFAIRGFIRSGTNWVNNIMNLHPEVYSDGEFAFHPLTNGRDKITEKLYWTLLSRPQMNSYFIESFEEMIKKIIIKNAKNKGILNKSWLGDRTPNPIAPLTIKGIPHILVVRDGRDVLVSSTFHTLRTKVQLRINEYPKMIEKFKIFDKNHNYFVDHKEELLDDLEWVRKSAKSWKKRYEVDLQTIEKIKSHTPVYIIKYEDLHENIEGERKKLYEFIGLDPNIANPLNSGKTQTTPGFKKEDPNKFYRKGITGDWKNYFTKEVAEIFDQEAGEMLKAFGYEEDNSWIKNL